MSEQDTGGPALRPLYIFDIDGTLADLRHRAGRKKQRKERRQPQAATVSRDSAARIASSSANPRLRRYPAAQRTPSDLWKL